MSTNKLRRIDFEMWNQFRALALRLDSFFYSFVTDADIGPNRSLTFPTAQCNEDKSNHLCTCILSQRTNNRQVLTGPDTNHILKAVKLKWVIIKLLLYCACAD